jgi:hypothetical protein
VGLCLSIFLFAGVDVQIYVMQFLIQLLDLFEQIIANFGALAVFDLVDGVGANLSVKIFDFAD